MAEGQHLLSGMQTRTGLHEMCCINETFGGLKQEGALPPSLLPGLSLCSVTIWKCPWKFQPLPKLAFCCSRVPCPAFPPCAAPALLELWVSAGAITKGLHKLVSAEHPQQGDNRTSVYFGVPCLISPWTWNPRFLHSFRSS